MCAEDVATIRKWATRCAALERDHLQKWERIDELERERDALLARLEAAPVPQD